MVDLISSRRNPLVARLRKLHQSQHRRREQKLLLEGTHLVQESIRLRLPLELCLATPTWIDAHRAWLDQTISELQLTVQLQPVAGPVLAAVATTVHPDGVVAVLPSGTLPPVPAEADLLLILDRLQDPGNLGTLMRLALAAGVDAIWLLGGADPLQPKVLRASAGAALRLPLRRFADIAALIEGLAAAADSGVQIITTAPPGAQPPPRPYWELDWSSPSALVLGNEAGGLDLRIQALKHECVTVPHEASVESLNVALAAAPLLLERQRQRLEVTMAPAMQSTE